MGNSLRCCLACILPCGALDLIRIVHLNGSVEELTGRVTAGDVLKNHPNHLLTKPSTHRRILILSPESALKRGSIYFLVPAASLPAEKSGKILKKFAAAAAAGIKKSPEVVPGKSPEKKAPARQRRGRSRSRSMAELWKPNLESISED